MVQRSAGDRPTVRAERNAQDTRPVALEHPQLATARRLPQQHRTVPRSAGDRPTVRAERNAPDSIPVAQLQNGAPCRVGRSSGRRRRDRQKSDRDQNQRRQNRSRSQQGDHVNSFPPPCRRSFQHHQQRVRTGVRAEDGADASADRRLITNMAPPAKSSGKAAGRRNSHRCVCEAFTSGRAATHRRAPCFPWSRIRADDGWCDEPADRNYNRPVRLPYSASAETMLRNDEAIRCRDRARLEYPPPRKGPRQCGFSPYRAARPSAHGGLRRHFATRYGAPAAPSVGQNGSQDLEIATGGDDPAGGRVFPKRPQRGRFACPIAGQERRQPPPRHCRRDRRPAPRAPGPGETAHRRPGHRRKAPQARAPG